MLTRTESRALLVVACLLALVPLAARGQDAQPMRPERPPTRPAEKPPAAPERPAKVEAPKPPAKKVAPPAAEEPPPVKTSDLPEEISGEKVEILLYSGSVIVGVVRDHRIEIRKGNRFIPTDSPGAPGAGIRVFYLKGLNGYIFVPYRTIDDIQFLGPLTPEESSSLVEGLKADRVNAVQKRFEATKDLQARKEARREALAEREKAAEGALEDVDAETQKRITALLRRFPPPEWTPEKLEEIHRRRLILDVMPTPEEKAWIESFDIWLQGYLAWAKEQAKGDEESAKGS